MRDRVLSFHPGRIRTVVPRLLAVAALAAACATPAAAQGDLAAGLAFQPESVASGATAQLRLRLRNTNDGEIGSIRFDAILPAPLRLVAPPDPQQCRGIVSAIPGGFQLRGGSLTYDRNTCDVVALVTGESDTTIEVPVSIGPIESNNGVVSRVDAVLTLRGGIPPKITSPPLASPIELGVPFEHQVTVTGTPPVTVTAEGLPPGLGYDAGTRRVTGAPTVVGTYVVTLRASNAFPPADAQVSTVEVRNPPLQIVTEPPLSPKPILVGFPATFTIEATGGQPAYQFYLTQGALPPGLALSTGGVIAGTPTTPGTYAFTVQVQDVVGRTAARAYELVVAKIPTRVVPSITPNPAVSGQTVTVRGTVVPDIGPPPPGTLTAWVAGVGERCPAPFESGADPVTPTTKSAPLVNGVAELAFENLPVGPYRVCAGYGGGPLHDPASIGPLDLFVIKGILLPSPKLDLSVPERVPAGAAWSGRVRVAAADGAPLTGARVRVRVGATDLGEVDVVAGEARFSAVAPSTPGAIAVSASTAGGPGFGPAASDPRWVAVVSKADLGVAIPATGPAVLLALALALAWLGAGRLARRK